MRVLLLGGTGSIGTPVLRELIDRGHDVVALARSDRSAVTPQQQGAAVLRGDIAAPQAWIAALPAIDGIIHLACDFTSDMEAIDRGLLDALLPHLARQPAKARFLHTGGCWLYGATGDDAELGEWVRGYACDQQLSGARAHRELGWTPAHLDPIVDIHQWLRQ